MTVEELTAAQIDARMAAIVGREPLPTDGPDYHADHAAWAAVQPPKTEQGLNAEAEAYWGKQVDPYEAERALQAGFQAPPPFRFVRPLSEAADNLIDYLQNSDGRIMTGLRDIDLMTRGFGPGELVYLTGYTHSGKTQVFLTTVCNNRDRRFVLFTPDESAEDVLTKLVCMRTRSNAERMEERVKNGDREAMARIRRVAREDFRNLIVIDQSLTLNDMTVAVAEAEAYWGEPPECVAFDYLELLRCDETEVEKKSQALKGWAVGQTFPTVCLHQGSRGNSAGGQALTMRSMKYGGEQEAIFVLGVRRERDDEDLDEYTKQAIADNVSISVIKNKRPPSKKGEHTFYLDPECGMILPLDHRANGPMTSASQARQRSMDEDF